MGTSVVAWGELSGAALGRRENGKSRESGTLSACKRETYFHTCGACGLETYTTCRRARWHATVRDTNTVVGRREAQQQPGVLAVSAAAVATATTTAAFALDDARDRPKVDSGSAHRVVCGPGSGTWSKAGRSESTALRFTLPKTPKYRIRIARW
jgi:hypothetical protein